MDEAKEFEGEGLEEALSRASESLGIPREDLDYEVMQQGRRGFLGVGGRGVRIRIRGAGEEIGAAPDRPAAGAGNGAAASGADDSARIRGFLPAMRT